MPFWLTRLLGGLTGAIVSWGFAYQLAARTKEMYLSITTTALALAIRIPHFNIQLMGDPSGFPERGGIVKLKPKCDQSGESKEY